eukprot:2517897-Prymnesium_polylepis.2
MAHRPPGVRVRACAHTLNISHRPSTEQPHSCEHARVVPARCGLLWHGCSSSRNAPTRLTRGAADVQQQRADDTRPVLAVSAVQQQGQALRSRSAQLKGMRSGRPTKPHGRSLRGSHPGCTAGRRCGTHLGTSAEPEGVADLRLARREDPC